MMKSKRNFRILNNQVTYSDIELAREVELNHGRKLLKVSLYTFKSVLQMGTAKPVPESAVIDRVYAEAKNLKAALEFKEWLNKANIKHFAFYNGRGIVFIMLLSRIVTVDELKHAIGRIGHKWPKIRFNTSPVFMIILPTTWMPKYQMYARQIFTEHLKGGERAVKRAAKVAGDPITYEGERCINVD